jgi:hypothetical protein
MFFHSNSYRSLGQILRDNFRGHIHVLRYASIVSVLFGLISLGSYAVPANAASSGWVFGVTHAGVTYCDEATINTGRVADGYIESNGGGACGNDHNSPSGYLGVEVVEFFNGDSCGYAGPVYNDSPASTFGVGGALCGDPGNGNYYSVSSGVYWNTTSEEYFGAGTVTSPSQSYNVVRAPSSETVTASGETEGPMPSSAFNGGSLDLSSLPDYLTVTVGNETVGFVQSSLLFPAAGEPIPQLTSLPVYNAALTQVTGQFVSKLGFVPAPGSGLPATVPDGSPIPVNVTSTTSS